MSPYTNYAKDTFFAPRLSEFTQPSAPPLRITAEEAAAWLPAFITRSIFLAALSEPTRQLMFNLIRRDDSAVVEYERVSPYVRPTSPHRSLLSPSIVAASTRSKPQWQPPTRAICLSASFIQRDHRFSNGTTAPSCSGSIASTTQVNMPMSTSRMEIDSLPAEP